MKPYCHICGKKGDVDSIHMKPYCHICGETENLTTVPDTIGTYYRCPKCWKKHPINSKPKEGSMMDGKDKVEGKNYWKKMFEKCPFCRSKEFLEGAHGGMCVNFMCSVCKARFNHEGPFGVTLLEEPSGEFKT